MPESLPPALRKRIQIRSQGRCELFVEHTRLRGRCTRGAVEIHHMLTKARGGRVLDAVGETLHLIHLCAEHHRMADGYAAYAAGLLIDGYVTSTINGRPVYIGSDPDLKRLYGRAHLDAQEVQQRSPGDPAA